MVNVLQTRCPHCSALLPRDAEWCSLCLTDLRPAPIEPVRESDPVVMGSEVHEVATLSIEPARDQRRGRHARPSATGEAATAHTLADTLTAIRAATDSSVSVPRTELAPDDLDSVNVNSVNLEAIDLSVLAGDGMPGALSEWSVKAQAPGAKVGLMVAGVAVVGGVALLLLTIAGLILR